MTYIQILLQLHSLPPHHNQTHCIVAHTICVTLHTELRSSNCLMDMFELLYNFFSFSFFSLFMRRFFLLDEVFFWMTEEKFLHFLNIFRWLFLKLSKKDYLRKNNSPSRLMPTAMHFLSRQYWQRLRFTRWIMHCWFLVHGRYWIFCWIERRKKPWKD